MNAPALRHDDLLIPQGTTWSCRWPLVDADGEPLDVEGWTARAQVRRDFGAADVLHEWSTDDGTAVVTDSSVTLTVDPDESAGWTWGGAPRRWDLELTSPTGDVVRVTQGEVRLDREITR